MVVKLIGYIVGYVTGLVEGILDSIQIVILATKEYIKVHSVDEIDAAHREEYLSFVNKYIEMYTIMANTNTTFWSNWSSLPDEED